MLSGRDPGVDPHNWDDFILLKLRLMLVVVSLYGGVILRFK